MKEGCPQSILYTRCIPFSNSCGWAYQCLPDTSLTFNKCSRNEWDSYRILICSINRHLSRKPYTISPTSLSWDSTAEMEDETGEAQNHPLRPETWCHHGKTFPSTENRRGWTESGPWSLREAAPAPHHNKAVICPENREPGHPASTAEASLFRSPLACPLLTEVCWRIKLCTVLGSDLSEATSMLNRRGSELGQCSLMTKKLHSLQG